MLFTLLLLADAVRDAEQQRIDVLARIAPSVVCVFAPKGDNGGSGVVISADGEALTNFHVVAGLGPFIKCGLPDGTVYWAVVQAVDPTGDLALIRLYNPDGSPRTDFPHATIGDSDALVPGEPLFVLGNPFLLADDFQPSVSFGVVSGNHRYQYPSGTFLEYTDCIQTDAAINPGNSGGPLFNAAGGLVGINGRASFEKRGRVYTGAGYAIGINQAKRFLDHFRGGRIADHGVASMTVRTDRADGKVYVRDVQPGSDADRRDIQAGDEVVRFGGRVIESANDFKNVLGVYPTGWRVPIITRRDGEVRPAALRLDPLHSDAELAEQTSGNPFGPPRPKLPGIPEADGEVKGVPDVLKPLYASKTGFTNKVANDRQLERVLAEVRSWGGPESFRIKSDGGIELITGPRGTAVRGGGLAAQWLADTEPADQPPGTGGLLVAVDHLRNLLHDPEFFSEFYYVGSEPPLRSDGSSMSDAPLVETVLARRGEALTRFHFAPQTAALVAMETQLNPETDPCRIEFGPADRLGDFTLPATWSVRHSGKVVLDVTWAEGN